MFFTCIMVEKIKGIKDIILADFFLCDKIHQIKDNRHLTQFPVSVTFIAVTNLFTEKQL
jgi:hypothetical protein